MPLDWSPLVEIVRRHQRFLLTTHVRPDGDGLGSMLALAECLDSLGKNVQLAVASLISNRYAFLDPSTRVKTFEPPGESYRNAEVVIVLDTGTWNQLGTLGTFLKSLPATKAVVDHHLTQDDLGATQFVDVSAEATGRLVYELLSAIGSPMTPTIANLLFVAIATDTGWFRHKNATAATFGLSGELVAAGADPEYLYHQLYEDNSIARYKLLSLVLDRLQLTNGGSVAYSEVQRDDYAKTGASPQDTEDLINYTRSIMGVEVGLFFMEQPRGGVKVSFRSRAGVDVAKIAEKFGGGGHRLASGAVVEASLEEARGRVLEAVGAALSASRP